MPINGFLYPGAKFTPPYQVANSCRFDDGSSDLLARAQTTGNRRTWTFSTWVKRCTTGSSQGLVNANTSDDDRIQFHSSDVIRVYFNGSSSAFLITNRLFRDVSAWYHIVVAVDTTQGTASNRIKLYVNGVQETSFSTENYPSQNYDTFFNVSNTFHVGSSGAAEYMDGYLAETVFIDGQQLTPTSFGEFDSDSPNIWKPIDVSGLTFGTNGFYLDFEKDETSTNFIDRSSNARAITAAGNVHHSVDQAKFNESSIEFDGTGDNLQVADSSDFDFGTGDFTFELFVYKQTSGKMAVFETRTYSGSGGEGFNLEFSSANKLEWYDSSLTADLPGDPSAISLNTWTHYAVVRYNNVCSMYKNGTSVGTPKDVGSASQNSTRGPIIGEVANGDNDFDGYMDEIRLSNVARYTGNFTAPTSPFTSDSNTVLLIQSNASNKIGADVSGQGNHFESSGITSEDQTTDTCTNNFATMNPLAPANISSASEGNLKILQSSSGGSVISTFGFSSGKWYWEVKLDSQVNYTQLAGVIKESKMESALLTSFNVGANDGGWGYFLQGNTDNGKAFHNNSASSVYTTMSAGNILSIAVDSDNGKIYFGVNGTYVNSGDPANGTGAVYTNLPTGENLFPAITNYVGDGSTATLLMNFGNPPFSISSGNSDANGHGNFEYSVPSGFFSLCSKNLAEFG